MRSGKREKVLRARFSARASEGISLPPKYLPPREASPKSLKIRRTPKRETRYCSACSRYTARAPLRERRGAEYRALRRDESAKIRYRRATYSAAMIPARQRRFAVKNPFIFNFTSVFLFGSVLRKPSVCRIISPRAGNCQLVFRTERKMFKRRKSRARRKERKYFRAVRKTSDR